MANTDRGEDEKTKVFVSYSRKDRDSVRRLASALEADGSIDVLLDTEDILPTEEWRARLKELIVQADTVVFCLTPRSAVSEVCAWEVATAENFNKRIAPIVIEDVEGQVPSGLAKLNYIFFTGRDDFETALAKLREALDEDIDWIREHTRIGELARRWGTEGRRRTDLLRGHSLFAAEAWLIDQPAKAPAPTALHRDFIGESRKGATRRQRQWIAGSTTVAAAAVALAALAYWQRGVAVEQRIDATARRLSAEAQVVLSDPLGNPETAVRDLLMSLSLSPSGAAMDALALGTARLPPRRLGALPWPAHAEEPRLMAFSPNGSWFGLVTPGEVVFWDVEARRIVLRQPLPDLDGTASLVFAEDSARALVTQRAEPGGSGAAWTAVELATGRIETATSDDAFDVAVLGSDILILRKLADGAQPEIVDLMTGAVLQRVAVARRSAAPVFGRFFRAPSSLDQMFRIISNTSVKTRESPLTPQGHTASPSPTPGMILPLAMPPPMPEMVLLVDGQGFASVAEIGAAGPATRLELPDRAMPLAIDAAAGLMAVRQGDSEDAVIGLPTGEVIWRARKNSKSFHGFAGGGRFLLVADELGARLESVQSGLSVGVTHGRRTDYDLTALTDLAQYTPIVSVEVAEQSGLIVTARRDGKVAVWRPGARPRLGASGMVPMPTFEPVASFDHGDTLGASEPFWTAPPVLFVSADGRYVVSQSASVENNRAWVDPKLKRLVRIWDSGQQKEIARFRPSATMLAAFALSRGILATVSVEPSSAPLGAPSFALDLWDLPDGAPPLEDRLETRSLRHTPVTDQQAAVEAARVAQLLPQSVPPLWTSVDLKLRTFDQATDAIIVVDDLTPTLRELATRLPALAKANDARQMPAAPQTLKNPTEFIERLIAGGLPAEAPSLSFPVAVSADGRRAAVALLGPIVRLYALDTPPRLLRGFDLSAEQTTIAQWPLGLALSPAGDALAIVVMSQAEKNAPPQLLPGAPRDADIMLTPARLLVYSTESGAPIYDLPQQFVDSPTMRRSLEQMIALGPEGRLLLVDETSFRFSQGPPEVKARLKVRDLMTGEELLALPARNLFASQIVLPNPSVEADYAEPPLGVFDRTGTRLAVVLDRPDCLMQRVNAMGWLPVLVPSCPDRRTLLSVWSLQSGKLMAATSIVKRLPERGGGGTALADNNMSAVMLADPMSAVMMGVVNPATMGLGRPTRIMLDDGDPPVISLDDVAARVLQKRDGMVLELTRTRRRVSLGLNESAVEDACARLPSPLARLDEATWATLVPAESYREICPSDAASAASS